MQDQIDIKLVAGVYKISNLPVANLKDILKFTRKHGYSIVTAPNGEIMETEGGLMHVYIKIPDGGFRKFTERFDTLPWIDGKPPIKDISLSQMKAEKGKFRAVVILDSEPYQIANDVDSIEEAKRLCRYYENDMQPVGVYDDQGKSQK